MSSLGNEREVLIEGTGSRRGLVPGTCLGAVLIAAGPGWMWASPPQVWAGGPGEQLPGTCIDNPSGTACLGQWTGTFTLGITTPGCDPDAQDDVGHAALLPTGGVDVAGRVLVWTECDYVDGHQSYLWDAETGSSASTSASLDIQPVHVGPFCGGHAWVVDESGNARLVLVGGTDFVSPSVTDPCPGPVELVPTASRHASWFGPLQYSWSADPPADNPSYYLWYPSVIAIVNTAGTGAFRTSVISMVAAAYKGDAAGL